MKNKFIEKPYQKFLQLQETNSYFIESILELPESKLSKTLQILQNYCYLITNKDQKYFDIQETFYDTEDQRYTRSKRLNRPKSIELKSQSIQIKNTTKNQFIIKYNNFHKTKELKLDLKTPNIEEWKINATLQNLKLSFPYIQKQRTEFFTRIILYQPHTKTKIHIDFNKHIQAKQTENTLDKIKITTISQHRINPIYKKLKTHL